MPWVKLISISLSTVPFSHTLLSVPTKLMFAVGTSWFSTVTVVLGAVPHVFALSVNEVI